MDVDDHQVQQFLDRSMTVRVATLSTSGVPDITPLRFIRDGRAIYALPQAESATARHIRHQPSVVLLFDAEETRPAAPVLRVRAHATTCSEAPMTRWYERRAATKYFLRPGGIWNMLTHRRNLPTWLHDRRTATPADTALIEFAPESAEFVPAPITSSGRQGDGTSGVDETTELSGRSPLKFVLLVFALSIPFWVIGAVTGGQLSPDLPVGALMFVCPVTAASILTYRESGTAGVTRLLRRSFDYKRISTKTWYAPILLLLPSVYALTYGVMRLTGLTVPAPQFPLLAALVTLLAFLVSGLGEELGWSGYAIDPMQDRWGALQAGLVLGLVWAVWHTVPLVQAGRSAAWIAWWSLGTLGLRVLLTWVYNNTGKSVFAAALVHALTNLACFGPFLDFGSGGYPYDAERIASLLTALAAVIVTVVWGPRTLTRTRTAGAPGDGRAVTVRP